MAAGFEIRKTKDGRVFVILHRTCALTKETILALLAKLGIDQASVTFLLPEEVAENCTDMDGVPIVIPIDQASCDAPELDAAGRQCGQAGGRVIVLFGEDFLYKGLHPIAEKYGTQSDWSASQLEGCVKDSKAAVPRNSSGMPVSRPKPDQVKC